jgi:outer membrane immunogenic protein
MKRLILATATALALGSAAEAADLPTAKGVPPAPVIVAQAFSWTGFYAGVNAGYNWGSNGGKWQNDCYSNFCSTADWNLVKPIWWAGIPSGDVGSQDGWAFGAQAGYNYQIGSIVVGVEGDIDWLGGSKKKSWSWTGNYDPDVYADGPDLKLTATAKGELNWLGTLRGRVGFAADHFLIYATGGLAFGNVSGSASITGQCYGIDGCVQYTGKDLKDGQYNTFASLAGSKSGTRVGWTLGAGAEYAITNNWTVKAEWLYYDLGSNNFSTTGNTFWLTANNSSGTWYTPKIRTDVNGSIARLGVNYKF